MTLLLEHFVLAVVVGSFIGGTMGITARWIVEHRTKLTNKQSS